ncbi:unnamed protein product [Pedinophyceae sp. YPF-701]|nr:unnamed protein product [Pedinophyceae sp. YPF-701]
MLIPSFQLNLQEPLQQGKVCAGHLYDDSSCVAGATLGGKVLVHNPHEKAGSGVNATQFLNINRDVSCVDCGPLDRSIAHDVLVVGTQSSVQAYDAEANREVFHREVADGASRVVVGNLGIFEQPVAVVGGNCSIQGFAVDENGEGQEVYWSVTGDNVSALALADVDGDGYNEILVGSEDFQVRVFQHEECLLETTETDAVTDLTPIHSQRYGYALANGTVGVYSLDKRAWRVKSRHKPTALQAFDLDGDGVPELISGWSSGKVEVRDEASGQVVFKDVIGSGVAGLLRANIRGHGEELVVCGTEGQLRGYQAAVDDTRVAQVANQRVLMELSNQRDEVVAQLASARQLLIEKRNKPKDDTRGGAGDMLPGDTKVTMRWEIAPSQKHVDIVAEVDTECWIRGCVLLAEGIFKGTESLGHMFDTPTRCCRVPVVTEKDMACTVHIKVLVCSSLGSSVTHLYESDLVLPRFAMHYVVPRSHLQHEPSAYVQFKINERVQRVALWIEQAFNADTSNLQKSASLDAAFLSIRTGQGTILEVQPTADGLANQVTIRTDDMALAGDIVQDMCQALAIGDLKSTAVFPHEMSALQRTLDIVSDCNANRIKFQAEAADNSNLVKSLVIRAEDSRILWDMEGMTRSYRSLMDVNRDLLMEHEKRATNHQQLLDSLKEVNGMIQKAARLRAGQPKAAVVSACRSAIRSSNLSALHQIIQQGAPDDV